MLSFLNTPLMIGSLNLPNRLLQGPLAGFSCAPFRELFYQFAAPAYCVTEMISAHDVLYKHQANSRYLYRSPIEKKLCYQIAGNDPLIMAQAAKRLEDHGADLIDINCGCPKAKIRKKGAGSALLEDSERLLAIVTKVRCATNLPLTVKIRIHEPTHDLVLVKAIEQAGADALIVHGRRWTDGYEKPCALEHIAQIKRAVSIPVIANGDIVDKASLAHAAAKSECDGFMVSRAGTGSPWLYRTLLEDSIVNTNNLAIKPLFMRHLENLATLESDYQAVLQSKSLVRYYFKNLLSPEQLNKFYALKSLQDIDTTLDTLINPVSSRSLR